MSGPASSITVSVLTNPLDCIRARIQVCIFYLISEKYCDIKFFLQLQRQPWNDTVKQLWKEEHLGIFTKSLSARLVQSVWHSFFIVLGYESVKKLALHDEYKHTIAW